MKKMNKKGFTLVELLAVIVILALIMAIAVVSMSGIMNGARRNTMKETGLQIINGVRQQLTLSNQLITTDPKFTRATGNVYYVSGAMLEKGGGSAPMGGTYQLGTSSSTSGVTPVGTSGLFEANSEVATSTCNGKNQSYVRVRYVGSNWEWSVCLTAGSTGTGDTAKAYPYITDIVGTTYKTEQDLLKSDDNSMIIEP